MKKTRFALLQSVIALLLCCSMLVGTTFAWFTDTVSSVENHIIAGNLDVELEWSTDFENWNRVNAQTNIFDETRWEPGHTEVVYLRVVNAGNLALQYRLGINVVEEQGSFNQAGNAFALSQFIEFGTVTPVTGKYATRDEARAALTNARKISAGFQIDGSLVKPGVSDVLALVVYMPETVGNDANHATGMTAPWVKLGLNVYATQEMNEEDSFNKEYDANAAADFYPGFQGGTAGAPVTSNEGVTTAEVAMAGGDVSAVIPAGVKLADGVSSLELSVALKDNSEANIQLGENDEMRPLDVHIEGVGADNTVPMLITLEQYLTTGINTGALKLYHVENGETVAMIQVENPVNHNEFSYDPLTGDVTLALASFSEVAVVADTTNTWDGTAATAFAGGTGTEADPYLIANASQLAYFRNEVDGGRTFADQFVKLTNNITLSNVNFDPIGWGYVNTAWNRDGADGKVFMGTFDGGQYDENGGVVGRYTIFDLYQNGWDLDPDKENYSNYTYTNCGFGLFAAASGATFKNLTISGADIVTECVEMGVLVGLSQNTCTYNNIKILDSKIANYQRPAGGLIGEVSGDGTTYITDVVIGNDVVVGSLWGDFDAPCGGVIGARWNDQGMDPQIVMTKVEVGACMDVYNDITSAYQWHAYRRAGMLIGNTELTDPDNAHKAAAPFLKCENVKVYYGDWVNYTYCAFSNHNSRYPWVRTQVGENCNAFSNPRWGVPNDAEGNRVTDMNHVHKEGDECNVLRQFSQLYGGGQGVYGQDKHDGVEVVDSYYSITYVNDSQVLDIIYVTDNSNPYPVGNDQAQKLVQEWAEENIDGGTIAVGGWMNAASNKLTEIPANNTKNIVLYPYFDSPYTASFVDQQGHVLAWCLFNDNDVSRLSATFAEAKKELPALEDDFELIYWQIRGTDLNDAEVTATLDVDNTDWESFKDYKDVTITPKYRYNGAELIEVIDELTGEIDHYQVAGYAEGIGSTMVEIPAYVNGAPVTTVNADAFSSYDDLHSVLIPGTITTISSQSFTADDGNVWNGIQRDTITMYYAGDPAVWKTAMEQYNADDYSGILKEKWDNAMGDGSRVFFVSYDANGDPKVDQDAGYWELNDSFEWIFHNHEYTISAMKSCDEGEDSHHEYEEAGLGALWGETSGVKEDNLTDYDGNCDCGCGIRPDAEYWTTTE